MPEGPSPHPPILIFFRFPCFFILRVSCFFVRFCSLSKDLRGSAKRQTLAFFRGFLAFFQNNMGWRVRAWTPFRTLRRTPRPILGDSPSDTSDVSTQANQRKSSNNGSPGLSRGGGGGGLPRGDASDGEEGDELLSYWYSAKRAGVKRACPNKVMAHIWLMHDAHLGRAFLFLEMPAAYTLLSMTVMVTPCLWYVVGMKLVCPMSKFPQAPFCTRPFWRMLILSGPKKP